MYVFSNSISKEPDVFVLGVRRFISQYKYLGILIDSKLTFKTQVKKFCKQVKFNLYNICLTRDYMSLLRQLKCLCIPWLFLPLSVV